VSYRPLLDSKPQRALLFSDYMQCPEEILSQMDVELYVKYYLNIYTY